MFEFNDGNIFNKKGEFQPIWFNIFIKLNLKLHKESLEEMGGMGGMGGIDKMGGMVEMDVIKYYI